MTVMTHIRDVRKRMSYMEHTFQPLRDMVMLLKVTLLFNPYLTPI